MKYDLTAIANELMQTALGNAYYGNALRVAMDIPGVDADDRSLLGRYATGRNTGTDHIELCDLANRINAGA
jgi:hypothetical protein